MSGLRSQLRTAGDTSGVMLAMLGAALLFVLLACANVANLLLVRGHARSRDLAIRGVLGARRGALVGQVIVETLVIAVPAGFLGLLLARAALPVLLAVLPDAHAGAVAIAIDGSALAVLFAATTATALLAAILPAWSMTSRLDHRAPVSRHDSRVAGGLIAVQVALAFALCLGAGLLGRSFVRVASQDPGFEPAGAWTFRLAPSTAPYASADMRRTYYDEVLAGIRTLGERSIDEADGFGAGPVRNSLSERRFHAALFGVFSVLAVVLAAVGVFGVVSRAVTLRTREFGVRLAIGAPTRTVVRGALQGILPPVAAGTLAGVLLAGWLSRSVAGLLFEVGRHDATTYAGTAAVLIAVSLTAAWLPARRAGRVDVIASLTGE